MECEIKTDDLAALCLIRYASGMGVGGCPQAGQDRVEADAESLVTVIGPYLVAEFG